MADVVELTAADTHALRRRVLRDGSPTATVTFEGDDDPGTFHLGVRDGNGEVVAIASYRPRPTPLRPEAARAVQLRGMAVDPAQHGAGLGAALLRTAVDRLTADGVDVMWANARDTAVGFYQRMGMTVVGDGFIDADTGLPHHVVVLDLSSS